MEKRQDAATTDGNRFVEVAPAGSPVALAPYTYYDQPPKATIGKYARIVLRVDDVRRTYDELRARGVRFDGEPFETSDGAFAAMRDPWDNLFVLSANAA